MTNTSSNTSANLAGDQPEASIVSINTDPATRCFPYMHLHGAALFPILAGSKAPTGIVKSFMTGFSTSILDWVRWAQQHRGCNFGVVACHSGWITVDIDVASVGRDAAWAGWCKVWHEWTGEAAPPTPHVSTQSGGFHTYFKVPEGVDPHALRQSALIKGVIDVRTSGYTVAPGSHYKRPNGEKSYYTMLTDAAPYEAPAALLEHCAPWESGGSATGVGTRNMADTADLIRWMTDAGMFEDDEPWHQVGMALKLEFGDAGLTFGA